MGNKCVKAPREEEKPAASGKDSSGNVAASRSASQELVRQTWVSHQKQGDGALRLRMPPWKFVEHAFTTQELQSIKACAGTVLTRHGLHRILGLEEMIPPVAGQLEERLWILALHGSKNQADPALPLPDDVDPLKSPRRLSLEAQRPSRQKSPEGSDDEALSDIWRLGVVAGSGALRNDDLVSFAWRLSKAPEAARQRLLFDLFVALDSDGEVGLSLFLSLSRSLARSLAVSCRFECVSNSRSL